MVLTHLISVAHAAGNFGLDTAAGSAIPHDTDLATLIGKILKTALGFVGTLFLLLMIYAGFTYMTARGDSKKIDSAKQMITGAIIGVIIIASAYAITSFVIGAVAGTGGAPAQGTGTPVAEGSVQIGGACTSTKDCALGTCSTSVTFPKGACLAGDGGDCTKSADCLGNLTCDATKHCK